MTLPANIKFSKEYQANFEYHPIGASADYMSAESLLDASIRIDGDGLMLKIAGLFWVFSPVMIG